MKVSIPVGTNVAGIKGRDKYSHPIDTVGCNYLSLLLISASGTDVIKWSDTIWSSKTHGNLRVVVKSTLWLLMALEVVYKINCILSSMSKL